MVASPLLLIALSSFYMSQRLNRRWIWSRKRLVKYRGALTDPAAQQVVLLKASHKKDVTNVVKFQWYFYTQAVVDLAALGTPGK